MMKQTGKTTLWSILNLIFFLLVVTVNALANILPINGVGTGAVSDYYGNLFAPAPITFAIWGVIYLLLLVFVIAQFGAISKVHPQIIQNVSPWFLLSCAANAAWIFAWHHYMIVLTVILMLVLLLSLAKIFWFLHQDEIQLTTKESFLIKWPFGVYFGWITVATIANITALLVAYDWNRFGLREDVWAIIIILIGAIIGTFVTLRSKSIPYALVIIWAYVGIIIKHYSADGFGGTYQNIMIATAGGIVLIGYALNQLIRKKQLPRE